MADICRVAVWASLHISAVSKRLCLPLPLPSWALPSMSRVEGLNWKLCEAPSLCRLHNSPSTQRAAFQVLAVPPCQASGLRGEFGHHPRALSSGRGERVVPHTLFQCDQVLKELVESSLDREGGRGLADGTSQETSGQLLCNASLPQQISPCMDANMCQPAGYKGRPTELVPDSFRPDNIEI